MKPPCFFFGGGPVPKTTLMFPRRYIQTRKNHTEIKTWFFLFFRKKKTITNDNIKVLIKRHIKKILRLK